jgi:hypothetical protein
VVPEVVLWDFGDTLADERWMRRRPEGCPEWAEVWTEVMSVHADDWNNGTVPATDVFAALANRSGMTVTEVEAHARECCRRLDFHETAWRVARERRLPQALVTVNPDSFGEWIVPHFGLASIFDTIVMSWAERTNDKTELCDIAIKRLGLERDRSRALLIDNRLDLVDAWRVVGGAGYWFQNDERFARDLPRLFT